MLKSKLYIGILLLISQSCCQSIFKFGNLNSRLKIASGSKLLLRGGLSCFEGTIEFQTPTATSLGGASSVTFTNGLLKSDNNLCLLTAGLSTSTSQLITLNNGQVVTFSAPTALSQNVVVASSATATINGNPIFSAAITLGNASSVVQMNINSILNQSITGLGKLRLLSDLTIAKNVGLPPQIDLNGYRLTIQGGTYSTATSVTGSSIGGAIMLLAYTNFTQSWTIGSAGESYSIIGNGNILELTGSGNIIFNGTDLTISNIIIKGLSSSNMLRGTGEIKLNNVTLQLAGSFTRSDGKYTVVGGNAKIITNNYTITMSGSGNDFKVDGAFLLYEQLNKTILTVPITTANSANITKLNGGDIISATTFTTAPSGVGALSTVLASTTNALTQSYYITPNAPFQINNATPSTPTAVSIDGNGNFLHFPYKSGGYLILSNNVLLTFSNIVLKNFYPAAISYGSSSTISFGDGSLLELGPDITIGSSDVSWVFTGNSIVDGNGATLTLNKSQAITIDNSKTLTLKNMRIIISTTDAIKALNVNAKVKFQNVDLVIINQGLTYSVGSIDIADTVRLISDSGSTINTVNFEFSSKGFFTILPSAELIIGPGMNFKYNADASSDSNLYASKRHLIFSQIGSKLSLYGCSLESTNTGLALDQGTIQIYDKVSFITTTSTGADLEFGSNLIVNIGANANLNISGSILYTE